MLQEDINGDGEQWPLVASISKCDQFPDHK